MYLWAREDRAEFWRGPFAKLIPQRTSLEDTDKIADDARELFTLITDVRRIAEESEKANAERTEEAPLQSNQDAP
jgi:hypothetical protein